MSLYLPRSFDRDFLPERGGARISRGQQNVPLWDYDQEPLSLWLDFSDFSTITLATGISLIADKSGNGRDFSQGTTANQPELLSAYLNGLDVCYIPTVGDWMVSDPFSISTDGTFYIMALVRPINTGAAQTVLTQQGTPRVFALRTDGADQHSLQGFNASNVGGTASSPVLSPFFDTWSLSEGVRDVSSFFCRGNTVAGASQSFAAHNAARNAYLGAVGGSSTYFRGMIGEIVVFDGVPSVAAQEKAQGRMCHKWGVQELLPAGHTYKTAPPTV